MRSSQSKSLILLATVIIAAFFADGCGMHEIESTWRDRDVTIDGIDVVDEWENARYFFGDKKITIGLLNDESDLYVRLSSRDRNMQRQLMALGLTVWFDAKGGKEKTLGIHFPIGMQSSDMPMMSSGRSTARNEDSDQLQEMLEESQKEIEIIGLGKNESSTMLLTDIIELGINVKMDVSKGNLVYELQIPLTRTELQIPLTRTELQSYGIGTEIAQVIGIGLEMGKIDMSQMKNQMGGRGGSMGGRGGGGMPGGGGMGGDRGGSGMKPQMPESLELWLKTELASEPITP